MTSTPTAPGVICQADVHHEPSCMGNGLLNHDPAAVAWISRGVMTAVRWEGIKRKSGRSARTSPPRRGNHDATYGPHAGRPPSRTSLSSPRFCATAALILGVASGAASLSMAWEGSSSTLLTSRVAPALASSS
jgi:hypothetical protein